LLLKGTIENPICEDTAYNHYLCNTGKNPQPKVAILPMKTLSTGALEAGTDKALIATGKSAGRIPLFASQKDRQACPQQRPK